jgi:hypothetical protein
MGVLPGFRSGLKYPLELLEKALDIKVVQGGGDGRGYKNTYKLCTWGSICDLIYWHHNSHGNNYTSYTAVLNCCFVTKVIYLFPMLQCIAQCSSTGINTAMDNGNAQQ